MAADQLLAGQEGSPGVDRERTVPLFLGQLGEGAEPPEPGGVDQYGHLAELFLGDGQRGPA